MLFPDKLREVRLVNCCTDLSVIILLSSKLREVRLGNCCTDLSVILLLLHKFSWK